MIGQDIVIEPDEEDYTELYRIDRIGELGLAINSSTTHVVHNAPSRSANACWPIC